MQSFILLRPLYALGNFYRMRRQVPMEIITAYGRKKDKKNQIERNGCVKQQAGGLIHHQRSA